MVECASESSDACGSLPGRRRTSLADRTGSDLAATEVATGAPRTRVDGADDDRDPGCRTQRARRVWTNRLWRPLVRRDGRRPPDTGAGQHRDVHARIDARRGGKRAESVDSLRRKAVGRSLPERRHPVLADRHDVSGGDRLGRHGFRLECRRAVLRLDPLPGLVAGPCQPHLLAAAQSVGVGRRPCTVRSTARGVGVRMESTPSAFPVLFPAR